MSAENAAKPRTQTPSPRKRPASNPDDPRMKRTDSALRDALIRLLEKLPLEQINVKMIAAEAGIHYATFFRHYDTKEDLLNRLAANEVRESTTRTLPAISEGYEASFLALCTYVEENRALWTVLLNGGARGVMKDELLAGSLKVSAQIGAEIDWLPHDLATLCVSNTIIETLAWWLKQPKGWHSVERMAKVIRHLAMAPTMIKIDEA